MTQQSASTSVGSRGTRARVVMASLGWAYLASLHLSDFVRASQLLSTFQREWAEYGGYVTENQPEAIRNALRTLPVNGRWEVQTANALALAAVPAEAASTRVDLVRTAGSNGTGAAGAADYFNVILFSLAPMGDEAIWLAYNWAQEVAPWDVTAHMRQRVSDYVEGFDSGDEFLPPEAQQAGLPVGTPAPTIYTGPAFDITATPLRAARPSYWPWAIAGAGVVTLAGILAWRKWGKK